MKRQEGTFLGNCPVCAAPYKKGRASVVQKKGENITFHVDCTECASSALLTVYSGVRGLVTTIGVPTDLVKSDLERIKRAGQITTEDVLELHAFLEKKESNNKK